ncbi:hypothetical protein SLA2020_072760 [Shorea laevis]
MHLPCPVLLRSMASSLACLLLITLLPTSSNAFCASFDCISGTGTTISYPFWHQTQHSEYCGYPGFNVTCHNQSSTLINLSNNLFRIRNVNYANNSLVIAFYDPKNSSCPRISHNFTLLNSSLFNYTTNNEMLHSFYNCTLYPPSHASIPCLQYNAKRSFAFPLRNTPEFDWNRYCESNVIVPAIQKAAGNYDFVRSIEEGFELTWQQPPEDAACASCEVTSGFCGFRTGGIDDNTTSFLCICSDGQHLAKCQDEGNVSTAFGPNYVAIGALIFGSLFVLATAFYLIQKRRCVTLYAPVSQH